jgi:hypothetical protein
MARVLLLISPCSFVSMVLTATGILFSFTTRRDRPIGAGPVDANAESGAVTMDLAVGTR